MGRSATALFCSLAVGCTPDTSPEAAPLTAAVTDSGGIRVIELSRAPVAWSAPSTELQGHPLLHSDRVEFGAAVDLAVLDDGTVAVLDGIAKEVILTNPAGETTRLSREGSGPGELAMPLALEALESLLVVWQIPSGSAQILMVFDRTGRLVSTGEAPVPGDWTRATMRSPWLDLDGLQRGTEDVTRRIAGLGDSAFLFLLEHNEYADLAAAPPAEPQAHILVIDTAIVVRDTISALNATLTRRRTSGVSAAVPVPVFEQPMYAARPMLTSGSGWYAIGHGAQNHVNVWKSDGTPLAVVRWPHAAMEVSDEQRRLGAEWIIALDLINNSESAEMWQQSSRSQRRAAIEGTMNQLTPFADAVPSSGGMLGAGACLFIQGFAPADHPNGSARSFSAVNVRTGEVWGTMRLAGETVGALDGRSFTSIRAVTPGAILGIRRNSDGTQTLLRFELPPDVCH